MNAPLLPAIDSQERQTSSSQRFQRIGVLPDHSLTEAGLEELRRRSVAPLLDVVRTAAPPAAEGVEALIAGWRSRLDAEFLDSFPELRYVGMRATTLDRVDVAHLEARGVTVTNIQGYGDQGTADFVMEQLLHDLRTRRLERGELPEEAASKTLGLVGIGAVGAMVARMAVSLGFDVVAARRNLAAAPPDIPGLRMVDLGEVLAQADYVSFHTPAWQQVVQASELASCSRSATIIATTLGLPFGLDSLVDWLRIGRRSAIFDLCAAHAHTQLLSTLPNVSVVPLFAARTVESRKRADELVLSNMDDFLAEGRG